MKASLQYLSLAELISAVGHQGARLRELERQRHRVTQQIVSENQHMGFLQRELKEKKRGN